MLLPSLDIIKRERERLRLSQKQLANMANVSTSMINQIESGRCKPSYETAKRIFEKLTNFEESQSETAEDNMPETAADETPVKDEELTLEEKSK